MNTWQTIGMIGAGRATRFLLEGWIAGGGLPGRLPVTDCNVEVPENPACNVPGIVPAPPAEAAAAGLVVPAVHPPMLVGVIEGAATCLLGSGRHPAAVMDMAPVMRLGEVEERILDEYRSRLTAIHQNL